MIAFVGLGNPGDEYKDTRHNAGFITIDMMSKAFSSQYWKSECGAKVLHCKNIDLYDGEILLVKPQSFMNLSGSPVKNIADKYKINLSNIYIIHDDMDILPLNIKVKNGGSSAGHNGLKSITAKLQTDNYTRIRIGIGRPPGKMPYAKFVLSEPKSVQKEEFIYSCKKAAEACFYILNHTLEQAQQIFNTKQKI